MIYVAAAVCGFVAGWFLHKFLTEKIVDNLVLQLMMARQQIFKLQGDKHDRRGNGI